MLYVRYQSAVANRRGTFPGVFALANGLAADGRLSAEDRTWWREANDGATLAYPDPGTVDPACFDPPINPGSRSWFKSSATDLLEMAQGYLALLDRYHVPWVEVRTRTPGRIAYEDDVQIVAVPLAFPQDWPFPSSALSEVS